MLKNSKIFQILQMNIVLQVTNKVILKINSNISILSINTKNYLEYKLNFDKCVYLL